MFYPKKDKHYHSIFKASNQCKPLALFYPGPLWSGVGWSSSVLQLLVHTRTATFTRRDLHIPKSSPFWWVIFFYHPQMVGFWHWVAHIIFDQDIYNQGTCWHVGLPPRFHHLWWLIYPHSPHFIVISHIFQYIMLFHCARWHACYRLLSFINAL